MTELICIGCPKGCHLQVDEENNYEVSGASCEKGAAYGKIELTDPRRVVTSTVRVKGASPARCSVKTNPAVPKGDIFAVMKALDAVELSSPVKIGDIVIANVCGTGADVVATRNI